MDCKSTQRSSCSQVFIWRKFIEYICSNDFSLTVNKSQVCYSKPPSSQELKSSQDILVNILIRGGDDDDDDGNDD